MAKLGRPHDKSAAGIRVCGEKILRTGEKMGTKRSVLNGGNGLPIAAVVSGTIVHDVKLPAKTLDNLVVFWPVPSGEAPQNLCLDAGHTGHEDEVTQRNCIPHIRPRGEEKVEIDQNPDFKVHR